MFIFSCKYAFIVKLIKVNNEATKMNILLIMIVVNLKVSITLNTYIGGV